MTNLADKIRQRRQQAGITSPAAPDTAKKQASTLPLPERIDKIIQTLNLRNCDQIEVAEELEGILANISQIELAKRIGKTQGWISQKIALLTAPDDMREKIRRGELSPSRYYRSVAERDKKLLIPRKQAIEIAKAFRDMGIKYGLAIELSPKPTNKEIITAFHRAQSVKKAVLKSHDETSRCR